MNKIYVFGHKSPDTDTIASAVVYSNLKNKLGMNTIPVKLGNLNKETKYVFNYLKLEEPMLLEKVTGDDLVMLVDHNFFGQSVDGIEKAKILDVVDHHAVDFKVGYPLNYHAEAVGCTATILYKLYKQNNVEIDKTMATLMLSAIVSDSLLFKSPTCTKEDIDVAEKLAKIAEINIQEYGLKMLKAGADLSDVSAEELVNLDSKEFIMNNNKVEIAQVNVVSIDDMLKRKEEIEIEMNKKIQSKGLDLYVLAITDILESNSQLIVLGKRIDMVEKAYNIKVQDNTCFVKGVVSRKKQIVPVLTENA